MAQVASVLQTKPGELLRQASLPRIDRASRELIYETDVLVLGAGPAGQAAAITSAEQGRRVIIIDPRGEPGGACTFEGIVPSKVFLAAARDRKTLLRLLNDSAESVNTVPPATMDSIRERIARVTTQEVAVLSRRLRDHGVLTLRGRGKITSPNLAEVEPTQNALNGFRRFVRFTDVVIATGSKPNVLPNITFDHSTVVTSDSILTLKSFPRSLTVLGGGVIACEYATACATLGAKVTLILRGSRLLPPSAFDNDIALRYHEQLKKQGITLVFNADFTSCAPKENGEGSIVKLNDGQSFEADVTLVALGRNGNTAGIGLEKLGVTTSRDGRITPGAQGTANGKKPHVFAAGDVLPGPQLASASRLQGMIAAQAAAGKECLVLPSQIATAVFSIPEVASYGQTEQDLKNAGISYVVGDASFEQNERALIDRDTEGVLKIVVERGTRKIVGVQILSSNATDLVYAAQLIVSRGDTVDDIIHMDISRPTDALLFKTAALKARALLRQG